MKNFMIKQLAKAFPKDWGFYLCENCAREKLENKDIDTALDEAKNKGIIEPCSGQICIYCKKKADYKLKLSEATKVM